MERLKKTIIKLTLVFTILISGQIFFGTPVFAVSAPTISINLSSMPTLNLIPGAFGSTSQNIDITTDNYTGTSVSLTNAVDATDLVNSNDDGLTIPTITLPNGSSSITASAFESGYGISSDGINYMPAPNSTSSVALGNSSAAGTSSHTVTFGAKPESNTTAGTYQRTFVIVAVVNNPQYSIDFEPNAGADNVTNMPSDVPVTASDTGTAILPNTTPSRSGYTFLGWDEDSTTTSNPTYSTGDTITLDPTQANEITLYAIWKFSSGDITETVENEDGSTTTTTTTYVDGVATEKTIATTDTSRNVSTQKIEYVNGNEVVVGYTINTSDNPNGALELNGTESIDTGVIAFDGNDFTISLTAILNVNDISGNANPIVAFRDYANGGCLLNVHNNAPSGGWLNEDNTSSTQSASTLTFGITKYTSGSTTAGSPYFRYVNMLSNKYYPYGMGTTEKQLRFVIQNTSGTISALIYNEDGTLVAQPASTTSMPTTLDFTDTSLDNITIVLGYFNNNGTNKYTKFDIVDFSVTKTLSN